MHKRVLLSIPHMGGAEFKYVQEAFETNWLSTAGPNLTGLEKLFSEITGLPAVALASGTAALHLGLKLLEIRPGDEVVTPTLTFAASCNPILYEHAVPVFMDCDKASWNLDPNLLSEFVRKRAKVNKLPKAVTVVHLFGQSADLDSILSICQEYGLPLLEDAAESLGAVYRGKCPGALGDVGAFSFNGNKIITGTTGGMLVANDAAKVERARIWSTQSRDADPLGINNYVHSEIGYNYRMSNLVAGVVRGQLEVLELRVRQRRAVFERYAAGFADLTGIEPQREADFGSKNHGPASSRHTRWLSCFLIDEMKFGMSQADLIRYLDAANIESRPVWKPMHTQPLYEKYECVGGAVAADLNRRGICLPSSSSLNEEDQQYVIQTVRRANRGARG